jgi:hypothetical protein
MSIKLTLGKRAEYDTTLDQGMLIFRMILMIIIALSIVILVNKFLVLSVDVKGLETNLLLNRLIYSPDCLSYQDDTLTHKPGIIDLQKFNEANLNRCLYFGERNDFAAANLSLVFFDLAPRNSTYYNSVGYQLLNPRQGLTGEGGSTKLSDWRYVLVQAKAGQEPKKAMLFIDVVVPND